jgi:glycopeptide antibiotics resistance protein
LLFRPKHRPVYTAAFSVLLVWVGLAPAWIGCFLASRDRYVPTVGIWAVLAGLCAWFLVRFSLTTDCLLGLLGDLDSGPAGNWVLAGRFTVSQLPGSLVLIVASLTAGAMEESGVGAGLRRGAKALGWALPWLVAAWAGIVAMGPQHHVPGLVLRGPAGAWGPLPLTVLLALTALSASAVSHFAIRGQINRTLLAALAAAGLTLPGWAMARLGLPPSVLGIELTFLRWAAVQLVTVGLIAWGGAAGMMLQLRAAPRRPSEGKDPVAIPRHPGRAYFVLAIVYAGFLIYGSLIPLDIDPMPLAQAWEMFWQMLFHASPAWSQADVVTNIAMFVPLTFFALGAWSRENRRRHWWLMAPVIFIAGIGLSLTLEFVQVFARGRVVSIHDVASQTIGNAIGLGAWIVFGLAATDWVRALFRERRPVDLCLRILYTYAALFVVHNLLPLNPTISATRILRKYKAGMINLVPFRDAITMDVYPLVMKTAVFVPIGYLLATRLMQRNRPVFTAVVGGLVFSCALEMLQVFVPSRVATTTDVVLGTVGAALGALLAGTFGPAATGPGVHGPWWRRYGWWVKLAMAALWLTAMAWKAWQPFALRRPTWGQLAQVFRDPLFDIVRRVDPLPSLSRLGREFGAYLVLGMLLESLLAQGGTRRRFVALALTAAIAVVVEFGRLFWSQHLPDLTVLLAALVGCVASAWSYPRFVAVFLKGPPAATRGGARERPRLQMP